jgi:hypothetical protein
MNRVSKVLFITAASLAMTGVAYADDPKPDGGGGAPAGGEAMPAPAPAATATTGTSLTLKAGGFVIAGSTLNINLSTDAVGKPVSLAPNLWYGINDKLTVGLTHDGGSSAWTPRPAFRTLTIVVAGMATTASGGAGICLTGSDNGCNKFYDNLGFDALYSLSAGKFSVAAHPGFDVFSIDEGTLTARVGVLGTYEVSDKIVIAFDPRINIGLPDTDFNKAGIDIPVFAWYKASDKMGVYVDTGIAGPFDGFGDGFTVPLGLGATFKVNDKLGVGGDFAFTNLLGNNGGADGRVLGVRVSYAVK